MSREQEETTHTDIRKCDGVEYSLRVDELTSKSGATSTNRLLEEFTTETLKMEEAVQDNNPTPFELTDEHEIPGAGGDVQSWRTIDETEGEILMEQGARKKVNEEDIWKHIFDMLNPSDMLSCSLTSENWRKWLEHRRTLYLFHKVIPFLLEYMLEQDLLNCRIVSSTWKDALDTTYQRHPQHVHFLESEYQYACTQNLDKLIAILPNKFTSEESIKRFSEDMEAHQGNPFPGKFVWLQWEKPENGVVDVRLCAKFWDMACQLLNTFGTHVHFININFIGSPLVDLAFNLIVQRCLLRLPNLRRLFIASTSEVPLMNVRAFQLPQLPDLETLRLHEVSPVLMRDILESCCIPTRIKRVDLNILAGWGVPRAVYNLPELEVLHLNGSLDVQDLERFGNLPQLPPLSQLKLHWKYMAPQDLRPVLRGLEIFADTLINVELFAYFEYEPQRTLGTPHAFVVNLPKLKRLWLRGYDGPLDIFSRLVTLKHLDVQLYKVRSFPGSGIEMCDFHRECYKSNLWTVFPHLKRFTLVTPATTVHADELHKNVYFRHNPIKREELEELERKVNAKITLH